MLVLFVFGTRRAFVVPAEVFALGVFNVDFSRAPVFVTVRGHVRLEEIFINNKNGGLKRSCLMIRRKSKTAKSSRWRAGAE